MDAIAGQFPWSWGVRSVGAVKAVLMSATGGCEGPQPSRNRWRKRLSGKDFIYMRDGALVHCNGQWISRGQAPLEILRNGGSDQGAGMIELERKPPALAVEMQFFAKQLVLKRGLVDLHRPRRIAKEGFRDEVNLVEILVRGDQVAKAIWIKIFAFARDAGRRPGDGRFAPSQMPETGFQSRRELIGHFAVGFVDR